MSTFDDLPDLSDGPDRTLSLVQTTSYAPVPQFALRPIAGGNEVVSDGTPVVIGTHPSATLRVDDRALSRFHCEIRVAEGDQIEIRDLGSRNGTRVDGVRIERAWLGRSALITVGRTELRFERGSEVQLPISDGNAFGEMVGSTPAIRRVFALLEAAAKSEITVLLGGETGTGKELAAEALHDRSQRRHGPFVVVDCGSLPEHLMQSELFGHVKGAFTGAERDRPGAFEAAGGGTIFLDEIGELPARLQPMLLRVLESRTVSRVGESRQRPVDVRIIAATHRDLKSAVNDKRFRADLYYRIAVFPIEIPPLRERKDDIPRLVARLVDGLRVSDGQRARLLSSEFLDGLREHSWPGNVRELRNRLEMSVVRQDVSFENDLTDVGGLPVIDSDVPLRELKDRWVAHLESTYLAQLMARLGGSVSEIAKHAGMSRMQIYRMLQKYGLREE